MSSTSRRADRERLLEWLREHVSADRADRLYYHLGDLRDAFTNAAHLIDELSKNPEQEPAQLRRALGALSVEVLEHIPEHTREVTRDLLGWRDQLVSEAETRGEL